MFRALFSVAIVLLLSTIALLLYANYVHDDKPAHGADVVARTLPPPLPPAPLPPIQQPPAPPIAAPVVDKDVKDSKDLKDSAKKEARENRAHEKKAPPEAGAGQQTYVVEAGDSLWSISTKLYGSGEYTTKIAEMNHMTLKDRIRPGQVLLAPDAPKQERSNKHESLAREVDSDMSSDAAKDPVKDADTQVDSDPLTTTNNTKPREDELEIQPPLLNVEVKKP